MTAAGPTALTAEAARRFAYQQGPGKRLLGEQNQVDDAAVTTAFLPPPRARGETGVPLPPGTHATLATIPFPETAPTSQIGSEDNADRLGRILTAALGLQRREPDHQYADHRVVASGRAKYPVHAFVADRRSLRYLDVYRHALIDIEAAEPAGGRDNDAVRITLAARYSDLPAAYSRLRFAVCEAEIGIALRSLCVAADVFGARVEVEPVTGASSASRDLSYAGPGAWSAPVTVRLPGLGPLPSSRTVGAFGPASEAQDHLLESAALDESVVESAAVSAARRASQPANSAAPHAPVAAHGMPARLPSTTLSWADVLWRRSAGRVAGRRYGFALRPATVDRAALDAMLAWAAAPPPDPAIAAVGQHVRTTLVLKAIDGLTDGVYRLDEAGQPALLRADPATLARLEPGFARPSSPTTDIGLRHASVFWAHSAETGRLLGELGPGGLALLNLWCGWTVHGLCLAAAAAGLIARPARSYDEHHLQPLLGLAGEEIPVFSTVCGTPRFTSPMLDLRP